jgi:hypothetical protein
MLIACLLFVVGQLGFNAATLDTWMDEGKYLMKGYWYFTGKIAPYSTVDPSFYMPLSFYSVAPMEWLFGVGYLPGRVLMIVFALGCLVLAYLTGARTGRSRLASVSAVVLIVGYPVTLTAPFKPTGNGPHPCPLRQRRSSAGGLACRRCGRAAIYVSSVDFPRPEARAKQESVTGSTRLSGTPICGARTACGTPSPKASVVRC